MSDTPLPNSSTVNRGEDLFLKSWHMEQGAVFDTWNGRQVVAHYGNPARELNALRETVVGLDLSARGRLCLLGGDRAGFLHGQVTNEVRALKPGTGNYAALVNAKGKMESDLRVYALQDELLIDLEPGFDTPIAARLEKYIISEDVQVVDASPYYGLLSLQGPMAQELLGEWAGDVKLVPASEHAVVAVEREEVGKCYFVCENRIGLPGYDLYVPVSGLVRAAEEFGELLDGFEGEWCGMRAWEEARLLAGIPRYGRDMDSTTLPPEAGLEKEAVSYSKGCYIGQEVIARIRTYGQVARVLRGLRLTGTEFPAEPTEILLTSGGREVGRVTSLEDRKVTGNSSHHRRALGYVRKEFKELGVNLEWSAGTLGGTAFVQSLPFHPLAEQTA